MPSLLKLVTSKSLIAYNGYDSGLGNRVRVVLGAKSLADLEHREFFFVWPIGPLFGPRMSDLWHFSGTTVTRAVSRVLARRWAYVDEKLEWLTDRKRREHLWQIRTGSPLQLPAEARSWTDEFRALVPVSDIANTVTSIFDDHYRGVPYVGVMIRAHQVSHAKTIEASPVQWFVDRMLELRASAPDVPFFISCDVPEVQERVMKTIPGCFAQSDKGPYNSVQAVRASVVDLYLLASAGYLLGPHFSSFIHLAEYLAGDILTMETAVAGLSGAVDFTSAGLVEDPLRPAVRSGARTP